MVVWLLPILDPSFEFGFRFLKSTIPIYENCKIYSSGEFPTGLKW